jgi:hypothetical protein
MEFDSSLTFFDPLGIPVFDNVFTCVDLPFIREVWDLAGTTIQ